MKTLEIISEYTKEQRIQIANHSLSNNSLKERRVANNNSNTNNNNDNNKTCHIIK